MSKSKGKVLRALGSGPVRITTYQQDWETRQIGNGQGAGLAVGMSLVAFAASDFRETEKDSDMWEFTVPEVQPDGRTSAVRTFLHGEDIFMVGAVSKLSGI